MSIRSMTGFARVRGVIDKIEVTISIKTVNHRGLDLHFYAGAEMDPLESAMRSTIKKYVARGHLDVRVQLASSGGLVGMSVDKSRLDAYMAAYREASQQYKIWAEADLNAAFRIPGILSDAAGVELPASFEQPFLKLLEQALATLNEFRAREGRELVEVMRERNRAIGAAAEKVETIRAGAVNAFHSRLKERLGELLNGANVDPQRLAQEAAILADRSDIGEEISRLRIHSKQVEELLSGEATEVGKKLDFLLQEMNREANTMLSKTSGIGETGLGITELALAAKADIEKIREQSLNLE
ncbi:MAG TPA: YicC/YloC family endoribonuclease [Bryobacteraceae bacterium]|nr:YicC/YloC family endoribonuclease [Bryobacteraceae bacterium]